MKTLMSEIKGFEGECSPVWFNTNRFHLDFSMGVSGFFKIVKKFPILGFKYKTGKDFHGYIRGNKVVDTKTSMLYKAGILPKRY